jgi:hypothetical protein
VTLFETELSDAALCRLRFEMRAGLWIRRCDESAQSSTDVRAGGGLGELTDRREVLFPVCLNVLLF